MTTTIIYRGVEEEDDEQDDDDNHLRQTCHDHHDRHTDAKDAVLSVMQSVRYSMVNAFNILGKSEKISFYLN